MTISLVCIDASLAVKLVLSEADSALAQALWNEWIAQQTIVIAPMLWAYEVSLVVRKYAHRGLLPPDAEDEAFTTLHQLPVKLLDPEGLYRRAWELARHFDRPTTYDAHYLALAEMAGCPLWTADKRLYNVVHVELHWVNWLGNYRPAS